MTKRILSATEVAELPKSSIVALWNDMADGDNPPLNAKNVTKDQAADLGHRTHARAAELGYCVLETDGGIELTFTDEVGPTDTDLGPTLAECDVLDNPTEEEQAAMQAALDAEPVDPTEDAEPALGGAGQPVDDRSPLPEGTGSSTDASPLPEAPSASTFLAAQGVAAQTPTAGKPAKAKRGFSPSPDDQRRIKLLQPLNPKRGKSALRYAQYVDGMTIAEYIAACVSKGLVDSGTHCRADVDWDVKRKFIELLPAQQG